MSTAVALFTRDLRLHDNPVLATAARAGATVPLFVLDQSITRSGFAGRHRDAFLADCLADLDEGLRGLGGRLIIRDGEVVGEVVRLARHVNASEVHVAADVSGYACRRTNRLAEALAVERRQLVVHRGVHTVVEPGVVVPPGKDHFAVFTPYWRRWEQTDRRPIARRPLQIRLPPVAAGRLPTPRSQATLMRGGEQAARRRLNSWLRTGLGGYAVRQDQLAAPGTSRLSPFLHFGCLSALEVAVRAGARPGEGPAAFVRQLAWRDFYAQLLAARPDTVHADYRDRDRQWRHDDDALDAWREGQTGYPIVDAGMRQLAAEGWMHNRARLITGSFLTKTLGIDWRAGAAHYFAHLLDGDVANNCLNWQWVAGTGTDTRPNRTLNPLRQALRFDPDGDYVRRWVPELAAVDAPVIHRPWCLAEPERRALNYPDPISALSR